MLIRGIDWGSLILASEKIKHLKLFSANVPIASIYQTLDTLKRSLSALSGRMRIDFDLVNNYLESIFQVQRMSVRKYVLLNLAISVPLWFLEASYSNAHCNFDGLPACASVVYLCIIPSILFFNGALKTPDRDNKSICRSATIALLVPTIVNYVGVYIANNTGVLGAEL